VGLKQVHNGFFSPKIRQIERRVWQEQNVITFLGMSGISPIDAINENSFSNFQRIAVDICNGCIKPGKGMDRQYSRWEQGLY
jgi:hypothetical protein